MYVPAHFAAKSDLLNSLLLGGALADLITVGADGIEATPLPLLLTEDGTALHGHVARNNPQWRADGAQALVIVRGPDAYITPQWYASKREHGRVVPTWNYEVVHVHGHLVTHDDPVWTAALVRRLTERHESSFAAPWSVDDAPTSFIEGQVRAIVGVEVVIDRLEAKAKLSQNRPPADQVEVTEALSRRTPREQAVANAMRELA